MMPRVEDSPSRERENRGHKKQAENYASAYRKHMDESFGRTEAARHEKVLFLQELNQTMPPPIPELAKPESPLPTKLAR